MRVDQNEIEWSGSVQLTCPRSLDQGVLRERELRSAQAGQWQKMACC